MEHQNSASAILNTSIGMRHIIIYILLLLTAAPVLAHKSWTFHAQDMYEVLQLEDNPKLTEWMKYISSDLIDGYDAVKAYSIDGKEVKFGEYLKHKYPNLKFPHRYLYHWGFNSRPWTKDWDEKVADWDEADIHALQADLIQEQKRRNRLANEKTETLFNLAHGGKEARVANVLLSIVYDAHILGDYEPDNKLLNGLQDLSSVVGDIISRVNALDSKSGKNLVENLKEVANDTTLSLQDKALQLNIVLKEGFSKFLQVADEGSVKRHLESQGFVFTNRPVRHNIMTDADVATNDEQAPVSTEQTAQPPIGETRISLEDEEIDSGGSNLPIFLLIGAIIIFVAVIIVMRKR